MKHMHCVCEALKHTSNGPGASVIDRKENTSIYLQGLLELQKKYGKFVRID